MSKIVPAEIIDVLLTELEKALKNHNWKYLQSDSGLEWNRGRDNEQHIARLSGQLRAMEQGIKVDALWAKYGK